MPEHLKTAFVLLCSGVLGVYMLFQLVRRDYSGEIDGFHNVLPQLNSSLTVLSSESNDGSSCWCQQTGTRWADRPDPTAHSNSSSYENGVSSIGLDYHDPRASCCTFVVGTTLEELCGPDGMNIKLKKVAENAWIQRCTCLDFFYCKLVVVTGFSSNHFEEAQDMIGSVQLFLPNTKLIVYDLGMTDEQRQNLSSYCNVELRRLDYERYPLHIKSNRNYAWKPLIAGEVAKQYEVLMWGDSSVRIVHSFAEHILPLLQKFPFVAGSAWSLPIISLVHDGMLKYLNFTLSRIQMSHFGHIQAGCWVMWANSMLKKEFLDNWVDCALHEECIAPPGSKGGGCGTEIQQMRDQISRGEYIGCHRYDQAALELILVREFGLEVWNLIVHEIRGTIFKINRSPTHFYLVKKCRSRLY